MPGHYRATAQAQGRIIVAPIESDITESPVTMWLLPDMGGAGYQYERGQLSYPPDPGVRAGPCDWRSAVAHSRGAKGRQVSEEVIPRAPADTPTSSPPDAGLFDPHETAALLADTRTIDRTLRETGTKEDWSGHAVWVGFRAGQHAIGWTSAQVLVVVRFPGPLGPPERQVVAAN